MTCSLSNASRQRSHSNAKTSSTSHATIHQNYLYVDPNLRVFDVTEAVNLRKRRIDLTLSSMENLERDLKRLKEMDDVAHVSEVEGAQEVEKARNGEEAETED